MPEYRRARAPGATFFFTVNTHLRQPFLIDADVRGALRDGYSNAPGLDRPRCLLPVLQLHLAPQNLTAVSLLPLDESPLVSSRLIAQ